MRNVCKAISHRWMNFELIVIKHQVDGTCFYTKTHQVHDSGMSEDVEYYHTTNHYHDTATFLKICNDITVL